MRHFCSTFVSVVFVSLFCLVGDTFAATRYCSPAESAKFEIITHKVDDLDQIDSLPQGPIEELKINLSYSGFDYYDDRDSKRDSVNQERMTAFGDKIATVLEQNPHLCSLTLLGSQSDVGSIATQRFVAAIQSASELKHLFVSIELLREKGSAALMEGLARNSTLKSLSISTASVLSDRSRGIGNAGTHAIVDLVKRNSTLEELELITVGLSNYGAHEIAGVLGENRTLKKVDISRNNINQKGWWPYPGFGWDPVSKIFINGLKSLKKVQESRPDLEIQGLTVESQNYGWY